MRLLSKSTMKISVRAVACPPSSLADGINSLHVQTRQPIGEVPNAIWLQELA